MEKSETIDVQSVTRDKALKSPVYKIVHDTWRYFDEKISEPVNLKEEDIVRLIIWSLENIKGGETDPTESSRDLRRSIVKLLREAAFPSAVVESLSSIVCAYAIVCLDCAFMFCCRNDIYRLCNIAKQSIKKEYKQYVSECKDQIKKDILQSRQNSDLGEWCTEHLLNDEFLTEEDGAWANIAPKTQPRTIAPVEVKKQRPVGRPKATDKPFGDYVSDDVVESEVIESIKESLTRSMGSACNVSEIIKDFIKKSFLKEVVPYKLLKKQFGELITCNESDYNRQVKDFR